MPATGQEGGAPPGSPGEEPQDPKVALRQAFLESNRAARGDDRAELELWTGRLRAAAARMDDAFTRTNRAAFADLFEGRWLRYRARYSEARDHLQGAFESMYALEEGMEPPGLVSPQLGIEYVKVLIRLGALDRAAEVLAGGLDLRLSEDPRHGELVSLAQLQMAHVDWALRAGLPDHARPALEALGELANGPSGTAALRVSWARRRCAVSMARADFEQAVDELDELLARGAIEERRKGPLLALLGQALARVARNEPEHVARVHELLEPVAAGEGQDALGAQVSLAQLCLARGLPGEAERWLVPARAVAERLAEELWSEPALVAALGVRQALEGEAQRELLAARARLLDERVDEFVRRWSALGHPPGGLGALQFGTRALLFAAQAEAAMALEPGRAGVERAAELLAEALNHGGLAARLGHVGQAAEDLRFAADRLVPPDGGLLIVLAAPRYSHMFALDAQGITHHDLPGAEDLTRARFDLVEALQFDQDRGDERSEAAVRAAGTALAEALLPASLRARLAEWQGLAAVGLETLGHIPLGALVVEGEWLGERLPITHLLSLGVARALVERPAIEARPAGLLLLAAPELGEDSTLAHLPWGPDDESEVVGPWSATVHSGSTATRAALFGSALGQHAALQLLCHGGYDRRRMRPALLWLANSDPVGCDDLEGAPLPPLVLLTTCGAARAPLRAGEDGGTHLGGAALVGGARAVLLSKFDLGYAPTRALSGSFHRALARDPRPSVALWRAVQEQRGAAPSARFSLYVIGLGFEPVPFVARTSEGTEPWLHALVIGLLFFGVALLLRRYWARTQSPGMSPPG